MQRAPLRGMPDEPLPKATVREYLSVCVIGALAAAGVVTELVGKSVRVFWQEHPFEAGLASGALLLAITVLVIDAESRRRREKRLAQTFATARIQMVRNLNEAGFDLATALERLGAGYGAITVERLDAVLVDGLLEFPTEVFKDEFSYLKPTVSEWLPAAVTSDQLAGMLDEYSAASYALGRLARMISAGKMRWVARYSSEEKRDRGS